MGELMAEGGGQSLRRKGRPALGQDDHWPKDPQQHGGVHLAALGQPHPAAVAQLFKQGQGLRRWRGERGTDPAGKAGISGDMPEEETSPNRQPQENQHAGEGNCRGGGLGYLRLLHRDRLRRRSNGSGLCVRLVLPFGKDGFLLDHLLGRLRELGQGDAVAEGDQKAEQHRQPEIIGDGPGHPVSRHGAQQQYKHTQQGTGQGEGEQGKQYLFHVDSS